MFMWNIIKAGKEKINWKEYYEKKQQTKSVNEIMEEKNMKEPEIYKTETVKIGNSLFIIIPNNIVKYADIKEKQRVKVMLTNIDQK